MLIYLFAGILLALLLSPFIIAIVAVFGGMLVAVLGAAFGIVARIKS